MGQVGAAASPASNDHNDSTVDNPSNIVEEAKSMVQTGPWEFKNNQQCKSKAGAVFETTTLKESVSLKDLERLDKEAANTIKSARAEGKMVFCCSSCLTPKKKLNDRFKKCHVKSTIHQQSHQPHHLSAPRSLWW